MLGLFQLDHFVRNFNCNYPHLKYFFIVMLKKIAVNAIRLIMCTLSSISDKYWRCSLAEEASGQTKQLQLKRTDFTSGGLLLSAVWLIGRHL